MNATASVSAASSATAAVEHTPQLTLAQTGGGARAPHVIIVGAGVGGLAAAVRLAKAGFSVDVVERSKQPGGRAGRLSVDGFHFDTGPTIVLMPEVFEELFTSVGRNMADYLQLERCDPNYRVAYRDGSTVSLSSDLGAMQAELERIEPGSFPRFLQFLARGHVQYRTSLSHFVGRNFDSLGQFLTPKSIANVLKVKALSNMYGEVSKFFKDDRLRAAMTFQTMYLGISPFDAPAVYGLLPYTELVLGIWFPKGGLYAIPLALERLGKELGVRYHYGRDVEKILFEGKRATGVRLRNGEVMQSEAVLCNADLPWAYNNLIDPEVSTLPRSKSLKYTSSAYMFYWGLSKKMPSLDHHNVFLGDDYRGSFDAIFDKNELPRDPSFYINIPSRSDASMAPAGKDGVYVLVPTPNHDGARDWVAERDVLRTHVLDRLAASGHDLRPYIEVERTFAPRDYVTQLNLERGSAFGLAHNFMQIGPFRPANVDPNVANLFFVGASTQPGTGLPTVMLSARLVTERLQQWAQRNKQATTA